LFFAINPRLKPWATVFHASGIGTEKPAFRERETWPFCGAIMPGYPKLHPLAEDFWPKFWKLYLAARAPDAGDI
jgi:hypothetical protein